MPVARRTVLKQLAERTDAERDKTTTVAVLTGALDLDERAAKTHLDGLAACELTRVDGGGNARVTITGEDILALGTDEVVIVDAHDPNSGQ